MEATRNVKIVTTLQIMSNNKKVSQKNRSQRAKGSNRPKMITNQTFQTKQVIINPNKWILPTTFRNTLTYYEQINYYANSTPQSYVFRGNSVFDPNYTGTGSQPTGFDDLSALFYHYYVVGSRIEVTFQNESDTVMQVSLFPSLYSTTVTYDQSTRQPYNRLQRCDGASRGGKSWTILTGTMATLTLLGTPWDLNLRSNVSTSPSTQWYWHITLQSMDQSTTMFANMQVRVYYDVIWTDPQYVPLS